MGHAAHHGHHSGEIEWAAMVARLELEGEVLLPVVRETASRVADRFRRDGMEVRQVLDIGCGPGVGTCELARQFDAAVVVAADGSAEMLERTAARAEAAGLADRVVTRQVELPDGLDVLDPADLIWAGMVLHHIGDEIAALVQLRRLLNPGGLLVAAEHGDPLRFLPADAGAGAAGLAERLDAANAGWLAAMRAALPDFTPSSDYPTMIEAAGLGLIDDRIVRVEISPPLPARARQLVLGHVRRMHDLFGERLDQPDRDFLAMLIDEAHSQGIMRRADIFLCASRHVYVATSSG